MTTHKRPKYSSKTRRALAVLVTKFSNSKNIKRQYFNKENLGRKLTSPNIKNNRHVPLNNKKYCNRTGWKFNGDYGYTSYIKSSGDNSIYHGFTDPVESNTCSDTAAYSYQVSCDTEVETCF